MGAASNPERDLHMASLLDDGFGQLGVPVTPRAQHHFHLPSLIESADAATLSPRLVSLNVHSHGVHGHPAHFAAHRVADLPAPHATYAIAHGRTLAVTAHARSLAQNSTCHAHAHRHCGSAKA
jgi:hypothetical protein